MTLLYGSATALTDLLTESEKWDSTCWNGLTENTRRFYSTGVALLANQIGCDVTVGMLTKEDGDLAVLHLQALYSPGRMKQIRSGWSRFRRWAKNTHRLKLPDLDFKPGKLEPDRKDRTLPLPVAAAVHQLRQAVAPNDQDWRIPNVSYRRLLNMTWDDVTWEVDQVLFPLRPGMYSRCNKAALDALSTLYQYAKGRFKAPAGPLIPRTPGAHYPMSLSGLRLSMQMLHVLDAECGHLWEDDGAPPQEAADVV